MVQNLKFIVRWIIFWNFQLSIICFLFFKKKIQYFITSALFIWWWYIPYLFWSKFLSILDIKIYIPILNDLDILILGCSDDDDVDDVDHVNDSGGNGGNGGNGSDFDNHVNKETCIKEIAIFLIYEILSLDFYVFLHYIAPLIDVVTAIIDEQLIEKTSGLERESLNKRNNDTYDLGLPLVPPLMKSRSMYKPSKFSKPITDSFPYDPEKCSIDEMLCDMMKYHYRNTNYDDQGKHNGDYNNLGIDEVGGGDSGGAGSDSGSAYSIGDISSSSIDDGSSSSSSGSAGGVSMYTPQYMNNMISFLRRKQKYEKQSKDEECRLHLMLLNQMQRMMDRIELLQSKIEGLEKDFKSLQISTNVKHSKVTVTDHTLLNSNIPTSPRSGEANDDQKKTKQGCENKHDTRHFDYRNKKSEFEEEYQAEEGKHERTIENIQHMNNPIKRDVKCEGVHPKEHNLDSSINEIQSEKQSTNSPEGSPDSSLVAQTIQQNNDIWVGANDGNHGSGKDHNKKKAHLSQLSKLRQSRTLHVRYLQMRNEFQTCLSSSK